MLDEWFYNGVRLGNGSRMTRRWLGNDSENSRIGRVGRRRTCGRLFGGAADVLLAVASVKNVIAQFAGNGTDAKCWIETDFCHGMIEL